MRIAICEDEKSASERLVEAIQDWADTKKAKVDIVCYNSAESFIMVWPEIVFDLIFLDIQMKNMSGIDLATHIRKTDKNIMLVFLTSFKQYVLKGYDVNALHYLIKPLSTSKLLPVLDKAYSIWQSYQKASLMVSSEDGQHKIPFGSILYISMLAHNAEIYTDDAKYSLRKTAKELIKILPHQFVRSHRSYIVNLFKVDCVYKESLVLRDGTNLPISRSSAKEVKDAFMQLQWRY